LKSVEGNIIKVELTDRFGVPLPLYMHQGRYFVEAKHMMEYQIRVYCKPINLLGRTEVLTAIDGRNTLVDEVADISKSRGMVVSGTSVYVVKGWRIDDDHTRPFVFTMFDNDTVAKQATGSAENLGVIAVAAYREYIPYRMNFHTMLGGDSRPKGGLESTSTTMRGGDGVGTGMGKRLDTDRVGHTTFERDLSEPLTLIQIFAMPGWWLKEQGIRLEGDPNFPDGFPGEKTGYEKFKKI
jgi:hypothetical protein